MRGRVKHLSCAMSAASWQAFEVVLNEYLEGGRWAITFMQSIPLSVLTEKVEHTLFVQLTYLPPDVEAGRREAL